MRVVRMVNGREVAEGELKNYTMRQAGVVQVVSTVAQRDSLEGAGQHRDERLARR